MGAAILRRRPAPKMKELGGTEGSEEGGARERVYVSVCVAGLLGRWVGWGGGLENEEECFPRGNMNR